MNIFYLDSEPDVAAKALCDKHTVSQCLEIAQILSTVSVRHGIKAPYKSIYDYHPVVQWAGDTHDNWLWTLRYGLAVCEEYSNRYSGRTHKSQATIRWCESHGGKPTEMGLTDPFLAMPEANKGHCPIQSYRDFYCSDVVQRYAEWNHSTRQPSWIN